MAAVEVKGLSKRFQSVQALDGVALSLGEGEVRGLLGPNGAGKTTLLRALLGLVRPDAGSIELFGRPFDGQTAPLPDGVSGFVEDPRFYPYLSGRVNLEILAELDGGERASRIGQALEQVGLERRAGERVGGYSSGMRQRLGIAAALLRAPRLLLLDEPTSGLDPAGVRFVGGLLRELAEAGVAVLLSSHQIGEIEEVCDGFDVLRRGRIVWGGSAEEMRRQAPPSAYRLTTSDEQETIRLAAADTEVALERGPAGELSVSAAEAAMDRFVLTLAGAGVAIRHLEQAMSPLESMFFALTAPEPPDGERPGPTAQGDR
jgi:ABC-2 type transport system ATP-binding protein